MPFQLRVEFTGLCLYLVHARPDSFNADGSVEAQKLSVVIPDCRKTTTSKRHADETDGKHHVGYLRFDLASLAGVPTGFPPAPARKGPKYEVVHRFTGQTVHFGVPDAPSTHVDPKLPSVEGYAPTLTPRPGLLDPKPQGPARDAMVMRTTISGGELVGTEVKAKWQFPPLFNPDQSPYSGDFAEALVWSRQIDADGLTLTLTDFGADEGLQIPLRPVGPEGRQTISVRIANLCCENPLEWDELETRESPGRDEDFKWLYRLLEPPAGTSYKDMFKKPKDEFPVPEKISKGRGSEGCVGTMMTVAPSPTDGSRDD